MTAVGGWSTVLVCVFLAAIILAYRQTAHDERERADTAERDADWWKSWAREREREADMWRKRVLDIEKQAQELEGQLFQAALDRGVPGEHKDYTVPSACKGILRLYEDELDRLDGYLTRDTLHKASLAMDYGLERASSMIRADKVKRMRDLVAFLASKAGATEEAKTP